MNDEREAQTCDGPYGPHSMRAGWYTVIYPNRTVRRFCDSDCLAAQMQAQEDAVLREQWGPR